MNEKKMEVVGIIGGAGVAASVALLDKIEQKVTMSGAFRDEHHPEIILYQATKVPSRSMFLENRGESFIPGYINCANKLKAAGATTIVMCCNTAHYAIEEIQKVSNVPFLNLVKECWLAVSSNNKKIKKVGVLCSDGTRKSALYEAEMKNLGYDYEVVYPNEVAQKAVTQGICNIKKGFHRTGNLPANEKKPSDLFRLGAQDLCAQGVDIILLACTEIPLDFPYSSFLDVEIIDTLDLLAELCIGRSKQWVSLNE